MSSVITLKEDNETSEYSDYVLQLKENNNEYWKQLKIQWKFAKNHWAIKILSY